MKSDIQTISDVIQIVRNMVCKQVEIPGFKLKPVGSGNNAYWINLPANARLYMTAKREDPQCGILFHLTYDKKISLPRTDWPDSTFKHDKSYWDCYKDSSQLWLIVTKTDWPEHIILEDKIMSSEAWHHLEKLINPSLEKAKELIQLYIKNWQKTSDKYEKINDFSIPKKS